MAKKAISEHDDEYDGKRLHQLSSEWLLSVWSAFSREEKQTCRASSCRNNKNSKCLNVHLTPDELILPCLTKRILKKCLPFYTSGWNSELSFFSKQIGSNIRAFFKRLRCEKWTISSFLFANSTLAHFLLVCQAHATMRQKKATVGSRHTKPVIFL